MPTLGLNHGNLSPELKFLTSTSPSRVGSPCLPHTQSPPLPAASSTLKSSIRCHFLWELQHWYFIAKKYLLLMSLSNMGTWQTWRTMYQGGKKNPNIICFILQLFASFTISTYCEPGTVLNTKDIGVGGVSMFLLCQVVPYLWAIDNHHKYNCTSEGGTQYEKIKKQG